MRIAQPKKIGFIKTFLIIFSITLFSFDAEAVLIPMFSSSNGWTEFQVDPYADSRTEDWVSSDGFVDPGWGDQAFDAEYLLYKFENDIITLGLQTGFNIIDGKNDFYDFVGGDLVLAINGGAEKYAINFGFDGQDDGLYRVDGDSSWTTVDIYSGSNPLALVDGTKITEFDSNVTGDPVSDSYYRVVSFSIFALDETIAGQSLTIDAHWTMSCGNDEIEGQLDVTPIPEPATFLLFGSGLLGLIGFKKKETHS